MHERNKRTTGLLSLGVLGFLSFLLLTPQAPAHAMSGTEVFDNSYDDAINTNLAKGLLGISGAKWYRITSQIYLPNGKWLEPSHVPGTELSPGSVSINADREKLSWRQAANASAKNTISSDSSTAASVTENRDKAWEARCNWGFLPTDPEDPEGKINGGKKQLNCQNSGSYARLDRSLESLLGPLQYLAPTDMILPSGGSTTGTFSRFEIPPKGEDVTTITSAYAPIYAAALFCQNLAMNAYADLGIPAVDYSASIISKIILQETLDSNVISNCWHFFEERVQYPKNMTNPIAQNAHEKQVARCTDDYVFRHIITRTQWSDCLENGRSTLKARYDMAHRLESAEYSDKFLKNLGTVQKAIIIGMIMGEPERFEQSLLMERQIMATAMGMTRTSPFSPGSQSYPMGDTETTSTD